MNMNLPHLHLILNHVPTIGTLIGVALLATGLLRKADAVVHVALEVLYGVALLTLPAYVTGLATQRVLADMPEVSAEAMVRHHDVALMGSMLMFLTGGLAWLTLWQERRGTRKAAPTWATVIAGALTLSVMAGAATLGGEIRHPEMVVGAPTTGDAGPAFLKASAFQALVTDHVWVWPGLEALHFLGLAILFGVIVVVNTRLMGGLSQVPFAALHRLIPWGVLALGINIISGMLFLIATPEQYADNISFHIKLIFLLLAGINLLYLTKAEGPFRIGANDTVPGAIKAMAVSAVVLWIGVMYFGRMLPFIGGAF
jgi:hypothetical protein